MRPETPDSVRGEDAWGERGSSCAQPSLMAIDEHGNDLKVRRAASTPPTSFPILSYLACQTLMPLDLHTRSYMGEHTSACL
jgi:hypothetical protein